jgi:hypothetical protein
MNKILKSFGALVFSLGLGLWPLARPGTCGPRSLQEDPFEKLKMFFECRDISAADRKALNEIIAAEKLLDSNQLDSAINKFTQVLAGYDQEAGVLFSETKDKLAGLKNLSCPKRGVVIAGLAVRGGPTWPSAIRSGPSPILTWR